MKAMQCEPVWLPSAGVAAYFNSTYCTAILIIHSAGHLSVMVQHGPLFPSWRLRWP